MTMQSVPDDTLGNKVRPYVALASADADREQWLAARRDLLTASDVPALLGWPKVGARHELWYAKRRELPARRRSREADEAADLGHRLEPLNAELFAARMGRRVERVQALLQSQPYPWLGCTLDYWSYLTDGSRRPLELKSSAVEENWIKGQQPCAYWLTQLATQCLVTGDDWGSLSCVFGSPTFRHQCADIALDVELAEIILEESHAFQQSLRRNQPPKWNADLSTYEVLRRLDRGRVQEELVVLPPELLPRDRELVALTTELRRAQEGVRHLERKIEAVEAEIAAAIGEAAGGALPNGITYAFAVTTVPTHTVETYHYRKLTRVAPKPLRGTRTTSRKKRRSE